MQAIKEYTQDDKNLAAMKADSKATTLENGTKLRKTVRIIFLQNEKKNRAAADVAKAAQDQIRAKEQIRAK